MSDLQANMRSKSTSEVQVKWPDTSMHHSPSLNSLLHVQTQPVLICQLGGVLLLPREELIQTLTTLDGSSELMTSKRCQVIHGKSMGLQPENVGWMDPDKSCHLHVASKAIMLIIPAEDLVRDNIAEK